MKHVLFTRALNSYIFSDSRIRRVSVIIIQVLVVVVLLHVLLLVDIVRARSVRFVIFLIHWRGRCKHVRFFRDVLRESWKKKIKINIFTVVIIIIITVESRFGFIVRLRVCIETRTPNKNHSKMFCAS